MKIHWLQHVSFEGLGCIGPWLENQGHDVTCTQLWNGEVLPAADTVDGLIVMGGPMGITDEDLYPWLADEKRFIRDVIGLEKPVLGICLGAQLIADVLDAKVWANDQKEIGFFPLTGDGDFFPETFTAFHWHGDTFGIPAGAAPIASSEACRNQGFVYKDRVVGLQFHLETTEQSLQSLYDHCSGEIVTAPFVQTLEQMRPFFPELEKANELMFSLLQKLFC